MYARRPSSNHQQLGKRARHTSPRQSFDSSCAASWQLSGQGMVLIFRAVCRASSIRKSTPVNRSQEKTTSCSGTKGRVCQRTGDLVGGYGTRWLVCFSTCPLACLPVSLPICLPPCLLRLLDCVPACLLARLLAFWLACLHVCSPGVRGLVCLLACMHVGLLARLLACLLACLLSAASSAAALLLLLLWL